jgi:hypothetical protein
MIIFASGFGASKNADVVGVIVSLAYICCIGFGSGIGSSAGSS